MIVVYNTCGISGKDNTDYYIRGIYSLLNQDFTDKKIVLSACLNKDEHIDKLRKEFGNSINYSIINEKYTVNITFNKTIQESIKHLGSHSGYLYMDSGCIMNYTDTISRMNDYFDTNLYGMVHCKPSNDSGLLDWMGVRPEDEHNMIVPVGIGINLHCTIFHNDLYDVLGNIIPDIFKCYCTESVFTFLCEAIGRKSLYFVDRIIEHLRHMDGPSSGYLAESKTHFFDTFIDLIGPLQTQECHDCGFGYEECSRIKVHNRNAYDENYKCKDPARLAKFIKENIFMSKDILDYNNIKCEWF